MNEILTKLSKLQGSWKGKGKGKFPTIEPFEYEEHLDFDVNLAYPLIQYQQKTFLLPTKEPSHWETGFIRVLENGVIEISNSQDSGRVEVMQGKMNIISDNHYEIELVSVVLANDPRMVSSKRTFKVSNNTLEYHQSMMTHTTAESIILPHLYSKLTKIN